MARKVTEIKEAVNELSKKELVDIVLKLASKRHNYEFILINYLDKEGGERTLFEEAKEDIEKLYDKEYKGRSTQHRAVKKLTACTKRLAEFVLDTKDKKLEADLMLLLLEKQFSQPSTIFGARFSGYDYKVGLLLKRLINLLTKKLHPDYLIDYQEKINVYLTKLHKTSNHINTIFELPEQLD